MLNQFYTSTKTLTLTDNILTPPVAQICYVKTWDAFALVSANQMFKMFRDASQALMAPQILQGSGQMLQMLARAGGTLCWFFGVGNNPRQILQADEISGLRHPDLVMNPGWPIPYTFPGVGVFFVDDQAGIVVISYPTSPTFPLTSPCILQFFDLGDGSVIKTVNPGFNGKYDVLMWAAPNQVVGISFASGWIALIDYVKGTVLWQSKVLPCIAAAFDCTYGLILTIGSDYKTRIYAMEAVPAVLAPPAFVPVTPTILYGGNQVPLVRRQVGYPVQTQLLGADGESIAGMWIHWSLRNQIGELEDYVTQTDENGFAKNYYFGPGAVGGGQAIENLDVRFGQTTTTTSTVSTTTSSTTTTTTT